MTDVDEFMGRVGKAADSPEQVQRCDRTYRFPMPPPVPGTENDPIWQGKEMVSPCGVVLTSRAGRECSRCEQRMRVCDCGKMGELLCLAMICPRVAEKL